MPRGVYERKLRPLKERFHEKLPPESERKPDECWDWQAYRDKCGYGSIRVCKKMTLAHRVAWELANDQKIPDGMQALHHCDNPTCCNPSHIYVGTPADNMRDMDERGRQSRPIGETNGSANVPDWIVKEALKFLKTGVTQRKVAEMLTKKGYPCTQPTVSSWVNGKSRSAQAEK